MSHDHPKYDTKIHLKWRLWIIFLSFESGVSGRSFSPLFTHVAPFVCRALPAAVCLVTWVFSRQPMLGLGHHLYGRGAATCPGVTRCGSRMVVSPLTTMVHCAVMCYQTEERTLISHLVWQPSTGMHLPKIKRDSEKKESRTMKAVTFRRCDSRY